MNYYAGIDGGGTTTRLAVADDNQHIIYTDTGPSINFFGVGSERAKRNLSDLLLRATAALGIHKFRRVVIGSSSLFDAADDGMVHTLNGAVPAETVEYYSDLDIALKAMEGAYDNIAILASGTGSMLSARQQDNTLCTVGGYGHLIGDEGSAYDIAVSGLRAAIRYDEGWGAPTKLVQAAKAHYGIDTLRALVGLLYHDLTEKSHIAGFAVQVEQLASAGDAVAQDILERAADDLFAQFRVLTRKVPRIDCLGVTGSVLSAGTAVRRRLEQLLTDAYPALPVVVMERPAEVGALRYCFDDVGYTGDLV